MKTVSDINDLEFDLPSGVIGMDTENEVIIDGNECYGICKKTGNKVTLIIEKNALSSFNCNELADGKKCSDKFLPGNCHIDIKKK